MNRGVKRLLRMETVSKHSEQCRVRVRALFQNTVYYIVTHGHDTIRTNIILFSATITTKFISFYFTICF